MGFTPPKFLSDAELVATCLRGDGPGWDEFVGRFSKLVHWSIRKTLGESSWASRKDLSEDIFQEFFKKILDGNTLAKLKDHGAVKKFIMVSVCHLAMDKMKSLSRAESRERPIELETEMGEPVEGGAAILMNGAAAPSVSDAVEFSEKNKLIESALLSLSPKERACVEFHYLDGYTHQKIAGILGIPQDTVSTVIRRAKEKVRTRLSEKGIVDL